MWTRESTKLSEGVSFQSCFQHAVASRVLSQVNRDREAAHWFTPGSWVDLKSRKSFGQVGLLLTCSPPWPTTLFDLHVVMSCSIGGWRRVVGMFLMHLLQLLCYSNVNNDVLLTPSSSPYCGLFCHQLYPSPDDPICRISHLFSPPSLLNKINATHAHLLWVVVSLFDLLDLLEVICLLQRSCQYTRPCQNKVFWQTAAAAALCVGGCCWLCYECGECAFCSESSHLLDLIWARSYCVNEHNMD